MYAPEAKRKVTDGRFEYFYEFAIADHSWKLLNCDRNPIFSVFYKMYLAMIFETEPKEQLNLLYSCFCCNCLENIKAVFELSTLMLYPRKEFQLFFHFLHLVVDIVLDKKSFLDFIFIAASKILNILTGFKCNLTAYC